MTQAAAVAAAPVDGAAGIAPVGIAPAGIDADTHAAGDDTAAAAEALPDDAISHRQI